MNYEGQEENYSGSEPAPEVDALSPAEPAETDGSEVVQEDDGEVTDWFGPEVPDWYAEVEKRRGGKKVKIDPKVFDQSVEHREAYYNMRNAFNGKMQAISKLRDEISRAKSEHEQERLAFQQQQQTFYQGFRTPEAEAALAPPSGEAPDPWTPEGVAWHARQAASEQMDGFRKYVASQGDAAEKAIQAAQAKAQRDLRVGEIQAFAEKYPDFAQYKQRVIDYRKANPGTRAEDAYFRLKGEDLVTGRARQAADPAEQARAASRQAMGKPGQQRTGSGEIPKEVLEMDGKSRMEWMRSHPEVHNAIMAKMRR